MALKRSEEPPTRDPQRRDVTGDPQRLEVLTRDPQRREPWRDVRGTLACSALKRNYRTVLCSGADQSSKVNCVFVVLNGSEALIRERMSVREHFMPPGLLQSQFQALELPSGKEEGGNPIIFVNDISLPVSSIVEFVLLKLKEIHPLSQKNLES